MRGAGGRTEPPENDGFSLPGRQCVVRQARDFRPQYKVLRILRGHRKTGLCGQHIVAQMVTHMPDITRLVDRLEANGLVRRGRTDADRRLVLVHITPAGLELLASLDEPILSMHQEQMKHLSRAEIAELNRLLVKLRQPAPGRAATPKRKALSR